MAPGHSAPVRPARLRPLYDLMEADAITEAEVRHAVAKRGDFPEECAIEDYKPDYVDFLVSQWAGVAKKILVGTSSTALHEMRGAFTPLRVDGQQVGWLLRSKVRCNPLVVSPGHRVSMASVAELVMGCTRDYRLPEPTRLADRIASRRGAVELSPVVAGGGGGSD